MRRISKKLSYFFVVLAIALIGTLLFFSVNGYQKSEDIPAYLGYKPLTVLTNSMQPVIDAGDMVFVKKESAKEVEKGDIITFQLPDNALITHRVIEKTSEGFKTKGDNNNVADEWVVSENQLVGTLAFTIPKAGYLAKFTVSKLGFVLLVLIPLVLFLLIEVYQRVFSYLDRKESSDLTS